jgi:hypothetical protein
MALSGRRRDFCIPAQFDRSDRFSEGLAVVELHRKFGYIDSSGRLVIPLKFVDAEPFSDGLALVYTTWGMNLFGAEGWDFFRRAGYIDYQDKFVIGPRNTLNARDFSEGVAAFQPGISTGQNPKWGYLDKSGKWAIKPLSSCAIICVILFEASAQIHCRNCV